MTWGSTWWAAKQKIPVHQPKWASFHKCDWSFTPHILTALQQPPSSHTDGKIQSRWARRQDWRKAVESQRCCSSLEDWVPLTLWHGSVSIETLKHGSWAWARIPPHTHTHKLLCVHLCLLHTQTHSCLLAYLIDHVPSKAGALPETTNKVSYLPLVPALFYQVTTLVSLLLSASLTLLLPLPLSLSLFLCFSPSLTLPSPPSPPSLLWWTSLPVGFVPWLFSLWRSQWFFLPLCSAQGQWGLILIPSGGPRALSSVWTVSQFIMIFVLLQHSMRMFVPNGQKKRKKEKKAAWACLHICVYAQVCVYISEGFEKCCADWTSVRESPAEIAHPLCLPPTQLLFRWLHSYLVMCFSLAASLHWLHGIFSVSVKCLGGFPPPPPNSLIAEVQLRHGVS